MFIKKKNLIINYIDYNKLYYIVILYFNLEWPDITYGYESPDTKYINYIKMYTNENIADISDIQDYIDYYNKIRIYMYPTVNINKNMPIGNVLLFDIKENYYDYIISNYNTEYVNFIPMLKKDVAEKNPISNIATVGFYYWKHGSDFVKYSEQMINSNKRVNNEFYVCPVFNEAISDGKKIKIYNAKKMWGLGTPEDLKYYLENN